MKTIVGLICAAFIAAFASAAHAEIAPDDPLRFGARLWFHAPLLKEKKVRRSSAHHSRRSVQRSTPRADRAAVGRSIGMITVPTAAGISITVAPAHAAKFQGFIADIVARGDKPKFISCYATGGHVRGSLHYRGEACDVDQRGWNKTSRGMYHVAAIASRHGLRDGCTFRDCGHIDTGRRLASSRHHRIQAARGPPVPIVVLMDIPR